MSQIQITSHSQLGVFESCAKKWEYEYLLKQRIKSEQNYFIIGVMCHESIEEHNTNGTPVLAALGDLWTQWLRDRRLGHLRTELANVANDLSNLYRRASAGYTGPDRIRKAGDLVADHPQMTKAWKEAIVKLRIDDRQANIDRQAQQTLGDTYKAVSLVTCYSESFAIMQGYRDPDCLASIEYIEFPLSDRVFEDDSRRVLVEILNPVTMPRTGTYLNGFIDLVGRLKPELGGGIVLLDHKTSSGGPPDEIAVSHHEQLLKYAWAWFQLTGVWPTHIGINHLRSGTCVIAPVDQDLALEVIERQETLLLSMKQGIYPKKDPFAYGSPCLKMRDGVVSDHCPHLLKCHPKVAMRLGLLAKPLGSGLEGII